MTQQTVVYLHPHFTLSGGAGTFVLETGKRLAEQGYRVVVISIRADSAIISRYRDYIEFHDLGGPLSSSMWFWLRLPWTTLNVFRILDQLPNALVFPQVFPANWWGFVYKWLRPQRRVVWMCQEPSAFIHSDAWVSALPASVAKTFLVLLRPLLRAVDVFLAQHVDFVFCNSHYTLAQAQKIYHFKAAQAETLHLGADLTTFQNLGLKRERKIITVSRLTKFKNIDVILHALQLLNRDRTHKVRLVLIGDGEERASLQRLTHQLGLESQVEFLGHVPRIEHVVRELNTARAFVLASVGEPFGLAPVEAMACGTPAVVSDSGGLKETVISGKTGFWFHGGDAQELSQRLAQLVDDEQLFTRMSALAVKRAQLFSWEKTTSQIAKTFQAL